MVLISHAFDAEEAARISYSQLGEMARDAAAVMSERKLVAAPALEASITGWAPTSFAPADKAVELRFLVGFAYKREDDPFYAVPEDEAAADAWFEERVARYRAWTETVAPLVKRCLAAAPGALDLYFLYQDLFFGAREQGMAELSMLHMMGALSAALEGAGEGAHAVVGLSRCGRCHGLARQSGRRHAGCCWPVPTSRSIWRPTCRTRWTTLPTRLPHWACTRCPWRCASTAPARRSSRCLTGLDLL
ncbi:hypothetical protein LP420_40525 [Massilia sp. B-10]|nr:hypothetical protein LP420_40525 [Massilia sp. B-10]